VIRRAFLVGLRHTPTPTTGETWTLSRKKDQVVESLPEVVTVDPSPDRKGKEDEGRMKSSFGGRLGGSVS